MTEDQYSTVEPAIAVIIPSLDGEVEPLLASIRRQTLQAHEVIVVKGVRPNGRARNQGVAQSSAPLLVFIDDDAVLGDQHALANLIAPLLADPSIGVSGAAKLLPPDAPAFQRWVAREVPRIEHPVVHELLESNPDPPSYYCAITTTCAAMRREVFEQVGGFSDSLVRGVDTEFFVRVRRALSSNQQPYRLVQVPDTWTYHPAPATMAALLRKHFLYGMGFAQEVRADPSRARGRNLRTPLHAAAYLLFRSAILLPNMVLPYSFADPSWRPAFKPLKALVSYVSALGYLIGWYVRYAPSGKAR